jgi:hypothetical protein
LGVADGDSGGVVPGVEFGMDGQSGPCGGRGDGVDDDFVVGQTAAPVHRDVAEQPVLDGVPLGGAGREVADGDGQADRCGQGREFGFQARMR